MRFSVCIFLVVPTLAALSGAAIAGEGCGSFDIVTHIFEASDADGSGSLSRQEYTDAGLERYGVPFEDFDANGDGETSLDEYFDTYDRHHLAEGEVEI